MLGAVAGDPQWRAVAFADDYVTGYQNDLPVIPIHEIAANDFVACGVGNPVWREDMIQRAGSNVANVIHETAINHGTIFLPSVVCANVFVSMDAVICEGASLNIGAVVGPRAKLGPYVTMNQYAVAASDSRIYSQSYIGMGAKILEGRKVAPRSMIAAGAVVTKDIDESGYVWAGVPAVKKKAWEM